MAVGGDVRPFVLLTLWLAKQGHEAGLDRATLKQRIRATHLPDGLLDAAVDDLQGSGLVASAESFGSAIALTPAGEDWLAGNFDLTNARETHNFRSIRGGEKLPAPSEKYAEFLPKRTWRSVVMLVVIAIAFVVLRVYLRRLGE